MAAGEPEPTPASPPAAVTPQPELLPPIPSPAAPVALGREKWDAAGIYLLNGIPTHSRGDQHAARIISGAIPYEQAVRAKEATTSMLADMAHYARHNQ